MTQHRSVNETLNHIEQLCGQPVEVEGILNTSFDCSQRIHEYWLLHFPKAERRSDESSYQSRQSGLWLEFGDGSIQPNRSALVRWEGKRVRVHGVVYPAKPPSALNLFEGNSGYFAHLEVYSIQRVSSEQRKDGN